MTVWAVLAGGEGRRYGQPKALAQYGHATFLDHCLQVIDGAKEPGDTVAVSVARDWTPEVPPHCLVVADSVPAPGPAHSIGRLASRAADRNEDLVFMAVDMLGVTPATLRLLRDHARGSDRKGRPHVAVACAHGRLHWVLGAIPASLTSSVADNAESVTAVQVLLQLCPIEAVEVPAADLLDVNTPDLRPISSSPLVSEPMAIQEVSVSELKEALSHGHHVVDVRETDEYISGHVPGATSIPLSVLTENVDAFADDATTYVICQVGGRSMRACEYLDGLGKRVVNVAGGTGAWLASGFDVVLGESPR